MSDKIEQLIPAIESAEGAEPEQGAVREAHPDDAKAVHPRSLRTRILAQQAVHPATVRSQPLPSPPPAPQSPPHVEPEPARGRWPQAPWIATAAVLLWLTALVLLTTDLAQALPGVGNERQLLTGSWLLASLLTFAPLQWRLQLAGLTWQGVVGWTLLGYILAFVPPPTGGLLDLPEVPVYLLLFLAVFYATAAAITPVLFLLGQRLFRSRLHRLDVRRARRQGYEAGLLLVALFTLAGLRVLTPLTGVLLVIVVVLLETLLLSQMQPEG